VAGAITVQPLHFPTLTRGEAATNVVAMNVNANVVTAPGGEITNEAGSLLVVAVTGNDIPATAAIVVLETVENIQTNAQERAINESGGPMILHATCNSTPLAPDPNEPWGLFFSFRTT